MPAKNDVTGDTLITKSPTDAYRDGWDRIFGKKCDHAFVEKYEYDVGDVSYCWKCNKSRREIEHGMG